MARKPLDLPTGVEVIGQSVRIRFQWGKRRRCETLAYPPTQKGIAAAAALRTQVVQYAKMGVLTHEKYLEFFPSSRAHLPSTACPTFFEYAQEWLDSLEVVDATRKGYRISLQRYWIPHLAQLPMDQIPATMIRRIVATTKWPSPSRRKNVVRVVTCLFKQAMKEEVVQRDPTISVPVAKVPKRELDPFTQEEADLIIAKLYEVATGMQQIYACLFEFLFYTGMRPGEAMALRWDEVDTRARKAKVCRIQLRGKIIERTKTKTVREVLLNERALHAIEQARPLTAARSDYVFATSLTADRSDLYIKSETGPKRYWRTALRKLGMRQRRTYDTRHTYATMCLMAGMNPAFIASQLGHSVPVLLSTYAKWLNSTSDWSEMEKLKTGTNLVRRKSKED
ncbi:tyrosine-type recombinase/integrase [Pseudomonas nitroreducens]|uniref:site-specific integrase n=1 Tax=Pseudomonas nitroreducens TaxID=46680 RepID=UPI0002F73917|nr:site-specific integrase [Pseudomonas nitroreducens]